MANGRISGQRRKADPTDEGFKLEDWPFYWLARTVGRYELSMDAALKRIGMDVPRWRVLILLAELDPASVSALAEHAVIRLSTMTRIVHRMRDEGMVETFTSATDGRVTQVQMTDRGREALDTIRAHAGRVFESAFTGFDESRIFQLNGLLREIFLNLEK